MLRKAARGFTLIELMIVVAIIGILASIAIPNFLRYQLRSKSSEAAVNLGAIKTNEISYFGSHDTYIAATANPTAYVAGQRNSFDPASDKWPELGWRPEGDVYFEYSVVSSTADRFTAQALADLDKDAAGAKQCWVFYRPNATGIDDGATECAAKTPVNQVIKASPDGEY
jgi:type IV pilus assembly protein PilA